MSKEATIALVIVAVAGAAWLYWRHRQRAAQRDAIRAIAFDAVRENGIVLSVAGQEATSIDVL